MYSFRNDYSEGAHPKILELLMKTSLEQNTGYGLDKHSERAAMLIKKVMKHEDVDIHFIPGGTQTNMLTISSFLKPYQCVIAADTGHINVHETGAIEATGHKVYTVPHVDGKLTSEGIRRALDWHADEHMVQPGMVYISDTTELGTVYTKAELSAISRLCREKGLLLFLDGARLASALTSTMNDLELSDIAELTDVFYIGGTKNGALFGEALVLVKDELKKDFRYSIKHRGAMLAKGFSAGIQFEALFDGDIYFELGEHANRLAEKLKKALEAEGVEFYATPCSNQLFPIVSGACVEALEKKYEFNIERVLGEDRYAIRFVTSWATQESTVDGLIKYFKTINR
ncbi:MAG: threonine aldolase family protein [Acetivibrio ethanolgignens]